IPKQAGPVRGIGPTTPQREGIRMGDPVRIIRDPLFGKIGQVSALPSDLQKVPTESEVRVLEVKFPDGEVAVIPRANIEVIEGALGDVYKLLKFSDYPVFNHRLSGFCFGD